MRIVSSGDATPLRTAGVRGSLRVRTGDSSTVTPETNPAGPYTDTRRCTCMGASRGFRNRADESDWSNIDVLRELRLRGAIRDVYSCMHSWARKSLVLCFAFGHLGVLFVSVASGISRRAYLIDVPRYFPSFSLRWSLTKQPHRYPLGTISIPISVLFNPLCL